MSYPARDDRDDTGKEWMARAACQGDMGNAFYPPLRPERKSDRREREARAKRICAVCMVRSDCLDYAVEVGERFGIWGGLTEAERR